MNKGSIILIIIGIILIIVAPGLFTQAGWTNLDFSKTGEIGDTIGGTTAPIIGILSIILLFYTLWEQIKFNKKQKEISKDEQFKTTLFSLLQAQRDILEKISGRFSYLGTFTYKEDTWKKGKIEVTKKGNEFLTINNPDDEVKGLDFFKAALYQLRLIYQAFDYGKYINNYDSSEAYDAEVMLEAETTSGINVPLEIEREEQIKIFQTRMPFIVAYTNDKYGITEAIFNEYQKFDAEKKVSLGYACFFNKYEEVGYYFRHIYQILKFIKQNEDDEIETLKNSSTNIDKEKVHEHFKQYAQFIQAQMSIDELLLLFYNSFVFTKAQKLIIHYDLLENLTIQNLIKSNHNCKQELKLKDKRDLLFNMIKTKK